MNVVDLVLNALGEDIARLHVQLRVAQADLALAKDRIAELEAQLEPEEEDDVEV